MSGVINFLRNTSSLVGKLFYFGGEGLDEDGSSRSTLGVQNHYFECSKPDVQPYSCGECDVGAAYSDGSFVLEQGDDVYNISEVENSILKYYNELGPSNWDGAQYRPYRWKTITNLNSNTKYKTLKMMLDKDDDLWYILVELKQPAVESSHYINKLQNHFKDD